jgi:hypothetical protein
VTQVFLEEPVPIISTDLVLMLSVTTGSAGDTTAQAVPGNSLGKYVSTTAFATGLNGLFDDISGAENAASTVDYRCLFIKNNHATLTLSNAVVYLSAEVAGGASIAIAVDNLAASAKGSSSAQAALIANELAVPSGVGTFSSPTTIATGLVIGTLTPGQVRGIWVKRTAANTAALDADGVTIAVTGDSPA